MSENKEQLSEDIMAWFLGPAAENADMVKQLILQAFDDHAFWRRNFHPEDNTIIKEDIRNSKRFCDMFSKLKQNFWELLANLKRDYPFFSPRYIGHMLSDPVIPAIIGYFAAMLYNPNNVTKQAAPVTVDLELEVAKDLIKLIGFSEEDNANILARHWAHLTSGGTVANFEALWVARNAKYFPFVAQWVANELQLDTEIKVPNAQPGDLRELSVHQLANLPPNETLLLRTKLIDACSKKESWCQE